MTFDEIRSALKPVVKEARAIAKLHEVVEQAGSLEQAIKTLEVKYDTLQASYAKATEIHQAMLADLDMQRRDALAKNDTMIRDLSSKMEEAQRSHEQREAKLQEHLVKLTNEVGAKVQQARDEANRIISELTHKVAAAKEGAARDLAQRDKLSEQIEALRAEKRRLVEQFAS